MLCAGGSCGAGFGTTLKPCQHRHRVTAVSAPAFYSALDLCSYLLALAHLRAGWLPPLRSFASPVNRLRLRVVCSQTKEYMSLCFHRIVHMASKRRQPQPGPTVHACALSYGHSPRLLRRTEWKTACVIARIRHWCLCAQADNRRRVDMHATRSTSAFSQPCILPLHSIALRSHRHHQQLDCARSQPHHGYSHDARGPRPTALPTCVQVQEVCR